MLIIVFLIGILVAAFGLIGWLWMEFRKEAAFVQEEKLVAVEDQVSVTAAPVVDERVEQVRRLEEQLKALQEKDKANEQMMGELRMQADGLRRKLVEADAQERSESDEKINHLRAENVAFRTQLDDASRKLKDLQDGVARSESGYARSRVEFETVIEQLRAENAQLREQPPVGVSDVQGLNDKIDELSSKLREFEVTSAAQAEKNEYLQYELTKSRAQVVGLERLCGHVSAGVS